MGSAQGAGATAAMLVGLGEANVERYPVSVTGLKERMRDGTTVGTSEGDVGEAKTLCKRRLQGVLVIGQVLGLAKTEPHADLAGKVVGGDAVRIVVVSASMKGEGGSDVR